MPYNSHENFTEHKIPFVRSEVMQTRNKEQKWQYFPSGYGCITNPMSCPASVVDVDGAASIGWSEV